MTARERNVGVGRDTVVGLFSKQADAECAIRELKATGIDETRIGVAMRDPDGHRQSTEDTPGRILGGAVGLLPGVHALAIAGVGPIIVGGTLASSVDTDTAARGLGRALVAMGVSDTDAEYVEAGLRQGSLLVSVSAGSRGAEARDILRGCSADLGGSARETAEDPELFETGEEGWRGNERRYHDDLSYIGPERRLSHR